jgi:hypothetical protein
LCNGPPERPDCLTVYSGAQYIQEAYEGTIPIEDIPIGGSFEIRYTLDARGTSLVADETAEAYVGDPLHYGTGVRMEYAGVGEFPRVVGVQTNQPSGEVEVTFRAKSRFYYLLYRRIGSEIVGAPVAIGWGTNGLASLRDPMPSPDSGSGSYLVCNQPLDQPLDIDADGIDDIYELQHAGVLDALNATDALADFDGDGRNNLREYLEGTDPASPDASLAPAPALFPARVVESLGTSPLRSGDVNHDGYADLVSFTADGAGIQTRLGETNELFSPALIMPLPDFSYYTDLLLTQVNQDEHLDVVVVDSINDAVLILLGQGDGHFLMHATIAATNQPTHVISGDLNNDGATDLVVVNDDNYCVSVFLNNGDGNFHSAPLINFVWTPRFAALGRFDGDGFVDLAVTLASGQVAILAGRGDGTFNPPVFIAAGVRPEYITAGDLNGDGRVDLVASDRYGDQVVVRLGNANGTFGAESFYATGDSPGSIVMVDLTGDGRPELVVAHPTAGWHAVLQNNGLGGFTLLPYVYGDDVAVDPTLLDVDRDGVLDLLCPTSGGHFFSHGLGGGRFESWTQLSLPRLYPTDMELTELNGDGRPDLVVANQRSNTVEVVYGTTDGGLVRGPSVSVRSQLVGLTVARLDADGLLDLAVVTERRSFSPGTSSNQLQILRGELNGGFTALPPLALPAPPRDVLAGDIDGDGDTDLVVMLAASGQALPFLGQGNGMFTAGTLLDLGGPAYQFVLKDFNSDGRADLVATPLLDSVYVIRVYRGATDGTLALQQELVPLDGGSCSSLFCSESELFTMIDGPGGSRLAQFVTQSGGSFGAEQLLLDDPGIGGDFEYVDVNADGRRDIAAGGMIRLASPSGGFEPAQVYAIGGTLPVRVVDLNGDGRPDLITADATSQSVKSFLHR